MGYAWALGLTLLVEVPVYTAALVGTGVLGTRRAVAVGVLVNLVTHPVLWLAVRGAGSAYWAVLAVGEVSVWLAEAWLVRRACRPGSPAGVALAASLTANAASVLVGLALP